MRLASNQLLLISAAGILAVGAGWAATIASSTPEFKGPNTSNIEQLASRINQTSEQPATELQLKARPRVAPPVIPVEKIAPKVQKVVVAPKPHRIVRRTEQRTPTSSAGDAVKNIALSGVTNEGSEELAWLVDISNNDRATAERGESAFGFTVKSIQPEAVVLAKGPEEFVIRMGDKQIPTVSTASFDPTGGAGGFGGGFGPGGFGQNGFGRGGDRGGPGGSGGFGSPEFMQRMAEMRARFGGGGDSGRSWGGFGGGNSSGRSWGGGGDSGRSSWGGGGDSGRSWGGGDSGRSSRDSGRGSFGGGGGSFSGRSSFGGGGFSGGFGGGGFGGGGFSGSFGSSSRQSTTANTSTSNPQTARRSGGRLVGDAAAMPSPDPISNPQTQRRIGSTSGPAFGQTTTSRNGGNSSYGSGYGSNQTANRGR